MQQQVVMIIHNNLLDFTEGTAILFICRKWSNGFVCCCNKSIKLSGKDMILNLADETYGREKPAKSLIGQYKLQDKQIHTLQFLILTRETFIAITS